MLETAVDQCENLGDQISERTRWGDPDERNAGIGFTESMIAFTAALAATFVARQLMGANHEQGTDRLPVGN